MSRRLLAVATIITVVAALLLAVDARTHRPPVARVQSSPRSAAAAAAVAARLLVAVTDLDTAHPAPDWRTVAASATPSLAAALYRDPPRLPPVPRRDGGRQRLSVTRTAAWVDAGDAVVQVIGTLTVSGAESSGVAVAWTCRLVATPAGWRVAGLS